MDIPKQNNTTTRSTVHVKYVDTHHPASLPACRNESKMSSRACKARGHWRNVKGNVIQRMLRHVKRPPNIKGVGTVILSVGGPGSLPWIM